MDVFMLNFLGQLIAPPCMDAGAALPLEPSADIDRATLVPLEAFF